MPERPRPADDGRAVDEVVEVPDQVGFDVGPVNLRRRDVAAQREVDFSRGGFAFDAEQGRIDAGDERADEAGQFRFQAEHAGIAERIDDVALALAKVEAFGRIRKDVLKPGDVPDLRRQRRVGGAEAVDLQDGVGARLGDDPSERLGGHRRGQGNGLMAELAKPGRQTVDHPLVVREREIGGDEDTHW